ncbi:hypothetical protein OAP18_03340 [Gammaproteobacteria bacterium]|nr:hypothetical protein [Gammaproteobacteria bacterium]
MLHNSFTLLGIDEEQFFVGITVIRAWGEKSLAIGIKVLSETGLDGKPLSPILILILQGGVTDNVMLMGKLA